MKTRHHDPPPPRTIVEMVQCLLHIADYMEKIDESPLAARDIRAIAGYVGKSAVIQTEEENEHILSIISKMMESIGDEIAFDILTRAVERFEEIHYPMD